MYSYPSFNIKVPAPLDELEHKATLAPQDVNTQKSETDEEDATHGKGLGKGCWIPVFRFANFQGIYLDVPGPG